MKTILSLTFAGLLSFSLVGLSFDQVPADSKSIEKKKKKTTGDSTSTKNKAGTQYGTTPPTTGTTGSAASSGPTPPGSTSAWDGRSVQPPKVKRQKEMAYINPGKRI